MQTAAKNFDFETEASKVVAFRDRLLEKAKGVRFGSDLKVLQERYERLLIENRLRKYRSERLKDSHYRQEGRLDMVTPEYRDYPYVDQDRVQQAIHEPIKFGHGGRTMEQPIYNIPPKAKKVIQPYSPISYGQAEDTAPRKNSNTPVIANQPPGVGKRTTNSTTLPAKPDINRTSSPDDNSSQIPTPNIGLNNPGSSISAPPTLSMPLSKLLASNNNIDQSEENTVLKPNLVASDKSIPPLSSKAASVDNVHPIPDNSTVGPKIILMDGGNNKPLNEDETILVNTSDFQHDVASPDCHFPNPNITNNQLVQTTRSYRVDEPDSENVLKRKVVDDGFQVEYKRRAYADGYDADSLRSRYYDAEEPYGRFSYVRPETETSRYEDPYRRLVPPSVPFRGENPIPQYGREYERDEWRYNSYGSRTIESRPFEAYDRSRIPVEYDRPPPNYYPAEPPKVGYRDEYPYPPQREPLGYREGYRPHMPPSPIMNNNFLPPDRNGYYNSHRPDREYPYPPPSGSFREPDRYKDVYGSPSYDDMY